MSDLEPAQTVDELIRQITDAYDGLPRQLKNIAKYVEQNRASVMVDRTSDIAARCAVHPSAVVRFAQRFGFAGFSDFQQVFKAAYTEQTSPNRNYQQRIRKLISDKKNAMTSAGVAREFIDGSRTGIEELQHGLDDMQFDAAVEMLRRAENIYVVGVRRSFPVASYIVYALQHTAKRVHLISGIGGMHREQVRSIAPGDVMIAISFAPYGKETQHCLRVARQHEARTLVITDTKLSPLARAADALLLVKEGSAFAFRSLTSTICLCQALFIALAYKMELDLDETKEIGGYDD